MPGTRKLRRPTDHRMSMLKGMVTYLLENGQIETTVTRAKEVSALADRMITLGKQDTLAARRRAIAFLKKESVVGKLFSIIAPFYSDKTGGYTRVLKVGPRRGDGAEMAVIQMVDADAIYKPVDTKKAKKESKKTDEKPAEAPKADEVKVEASAKKTTSRKPKADEVSSEAAE